MSTFNDLISTYGGDLEEDFGHEGDHSVVLEKTVQDDSQLVNYGYDDHQLTYNLTSCFSETKSSSFLFIKENSITIKSEASLGMGLNIFSPSTSTNEEKASDDHDLMPKTSSSFPRRDLLSKTNSCSISDLAKWREEYPDPEETKTSQAVLAIVKKFSNLRRTGGNINRDLRRQKLFKNPDLLEHLIRENNLIEIGSNFPEGTYNPFQWDATSFYDALAKEQAKLLEEEKKKAEQDAMRKSKDKSKKTHPPRRGNDDDRENKRRRST